MGKVTVCRCDLTQLGVDAVVIPTGAQLTMTNGLAETIRRRGGSSIEEQAVRQRPLALGEAVITGGGSLRAKHVIHAVVVAEDGKTDPLVIRTAARNALRVANMNHLKRVAFAPLSAGSPRLPLEQILRIMVDAIEDELREKTSIREVTLAAETEEVERAFGRQLTGETTEQTFFVANSVNQAMLRELAGDFAAGLLPTPPQLVAVQVKVLMGTVDGQFYCLVRARDSSAIWEALRPYDPYVTHRSVSPVIKLEEWLDQDRFSL
jgi:O-acetyl-ADP-ribose deacetylase